MKSIFGDMFDFNHDGELDSFERAVEFTFFDEITRDEYEDDEKINELEDAGLDVDELEFMDEYERREALRGAGLDPDDYDF